MRKEIKGEKVIIGVQKEELEDAISSMEQLKPILQKQVMLLNRENTIQGLKDREELGKHFDTAIDAMTMLWSAMEEKEKYGCYKESEVEFDVLYADKTKRHVSEGILVEFIEEKIHCHIGTSRKEAVFAAVEAIEELIEVTGLSEQYKKYRGTEKKEEAWVLCGEKLPEKSGGYICTIETEEHGRETIMCWFEGGEWDGFENEEVIAWQSIPEPKKPELYE